jgi:hypothetical protein
MDCMGLDHRERSDDYNGSLSHDVASLDSRMEVMGYEVDCRSAYSQSGAMVVMDGRGVLSRAEVAGLVVFRTCLLPVCQVLMKCMRSCDDGGDGGVYVAMSW